MKNQLSLALALFAVAILPGCFFSRTVQNRPLVQEEIDQLVPGRSTAADVVALLGAPMEVVQLGRRSAYRYDHSKQKQTALFLLIISFRGVDQQQDRAWVFFDENEVLTHVGVTLEAKTPTYRIPPFASSVDK